MVKRIIYLEDGRVAREGTFHEIMKENEAFAAYITSRIEASKDVVNGDDSGLKATKKEAGQKTKNTKEFRKNDANVGLV